ncbi:alpha/beta fold hydrolase [Candidatus Rhodobacter oscarellae]|nr:alpha/beta hydrolase [Candidatus Rhodobacter lobularis]
MSLFPGFTLETVPLPGGDVRVRRGGSGPPLVCLHGNPQTHMMWHAVAPALAERFTVYCPDLRGYGFSPKPGYTADHAPYSKRAMAGDVIALMDHFGHECFTVVSHDRGARAAHRLALDHPARVDKLAVMDIVPTLEHFERTDMLFALAYAHWFYLAMQAPFPEQIIENDPEGWFHGHTRREPKEAGLFHPEALADYLSAIRDRDVIRGICEDYRAAASIDLEHDRTSREELVRLQCPLLVLWGDQGIIGKFYEPIAIWSGYADGPVSGRAVACGHYLAEEAPGEVLGALWAFLEK